MAGCDTRGVPPAVPDVDPVPPSWLNWRQYEAEEPERGAFEMALHTDSHVTGDRVACGPYLLFNAIALETVYGSYLPDAPVGIVLRATWHSVASAPETLSRTNTAAYHGANIDEELASLVSLALGIRCRSGGVTREFQAGDDPRGRPTGWSTHTPMPLTFATAPGLMFPSLRRRGVSLDSAHDLLAWYPKCTEAAARVLVKAARLYQEALWSAESDPNGAWVQLVAALEVAAVFALRDGATPLEHVRKVEPEWAAWLDKLDEADRAGFARSLAPLVKSTQRFLQLCLNNLPDPPDSRPQQNLLRWIGAGWRSTSRRSTACDPDISTMGRRSPSQCSDPPSSWGKPPAGCLPRDRWALALVARVAHGLQRTCPCTCLFSPTSSEESC